MSKIYLKVKIASLAAEARIIRNLEKRRRTRLTKRHIPLISDNIWCGLNTHRRFELRVEARCAHLAYGFLRSKAYRTIENAPHWLKPPFSKQQPNLRRIAEIVCKFADLNGKLVESYKTRNRPMREALVDDLDNWMKQEPAG